MTTTTAAGTPALHQLVLSDLGANLGKLEHLMTSTNRELLDAVVATLAARASDRMCHDDIDMLGRNKRARLALVTRLPAGLLPGLLLLPLLRAGLVRRRRLRGVRRVAVQHPLNFGETSVEFSDLGVALRKRRVTLSERGLAFSERGLEGGDLNQQVVHQTLRSHLRPPWDRSFDRGGERLLAWRQRARSNNT